MDTKEKNRQGKTRRPAADARTRSASTATRQPRKTAAEPGKKRTSAQQPIRNAQIKRPAEQPARRKSPAKHPAQQPARRQRPTTEPTIAQKKQRRMRPAPEVVYTPPKPFSRTRMLLHQATIVAVVIAGVFGMSIFFRVENIAVSGNQAYSAWAVREASGIQEGDGLLTFSKATASGKITTALPYVEKVRIGIKLPDTVNIEIVESSVVYSLKDGGGYWWLMTSGGRILEQVDSAKAGEYTTILGVTLANPTVGQQAVAVEQDPGATNESGETVPVTVRGSEQLAAVLSILQYLEQNDIIGQAASVDVTDLGRMKLWYGTQYEVILGDTTQLGYKITCLKSAVDQMNDYQTGVLDISFTTWPDQIGYTPFT